MTQITNPRRTTLLLVDVQQAFGNVVPVPNATAAVANARRLADAWRENGESPIVTQHVYDSKEEVGRIQDFIPHIHSVLKSDSDHAELYPGFREGTEIVRKNRFSAVLGTDLISRLRNRETEVVVVAGLTTPICVQATVDSLAMADFRVVVAEDACAAQAMGDAATAEDSHLAAIRRMGYVFAEVLTTRHVLDRFRAMSVAAAS